MPFRIPLYLLQTSSTIADQPVGFAAGRQAAQERIQNIRGGSRSASSSEIADDDAVVVAPAPATVD